ncbi:MAG TPA: GntP family permease [Bacteroidales bacterium]|nr:GntP family permease [Bacteroidales bacterium]
MSLLYGLILILTGIIFIIVLTSWFKINAFLSLFVVSLTLALLALPLPDILPAMKKGFGDTMASIGLIIIFGTVIGVVLDTTGATVSMANYILGMTGKGNAPAAISITGFITGLPIFCDSGFVVLSGLNKSLTAKSMSNPVFMSTVLATSLYAVHCIIPPHPGATAAAGIIGANIGQLVLIGISVALPAALAAFFWARFMTRRYSIKTEAIHETEMSTAAAAQLPAAGKSFMPIIIPLLLITGKSLADFLFPGGTSGMARLAGFAGEPVIALFIGVLLALLLLPAFNRDTLNKILTVSIEKAGPIIIVTAAGGVFGSVIRATGVGEQAGSFLATTGLGLLVPFLLAFILKTAQGSSTVAIITTASIIGPMLDNMGYAGETGKILVMLAMGAGSMMVSHANDSYFWVITKFSAIESGDTLKVYSTATVVMGITAFGMVMVLSLILL